MAKKQEDQVREAAERLLDVLEHSGERSFAELDDAKRALREALDA